MSVNLISRSWTQAASSESYQCREVQATADLYLTGFHPTLPPGQFRMWVVTSDAATNATPGDFACASTTITASGNRLIYAAGMGTNDIQFPSGAGVRIRNGQYVTLIVHLVTSRAAHQGHVRAAQTASQVANEADTIFAGTTAISIPPPGVGTATGGRTAAGTGASRPATDGESLYTPDHHPTHSATTTLHDEL
jgi:hypothetical protein